MNGPNDEKDDILIIGSDNELVSEATAMSILKLRFLINQLIIIGC